MFTITTLYYLQKLNKKKKKRCIERRKLKYKLCQKSLYERVCYDPSLPLLSTKTSKTWNELCLEGRKLKRKLCRISPQQHVYQGFPPSTIYKNSKNIIICVTDSFRCLEDLGRGTCGKHLSFYFALNNVSVHPGIFLFKKEK